MRRLRSGIVAIAIALSTVALAVTPASAEPPHATIVGNANGTVTLTYVDVPGPDVNPGVYFCAASVLPEDCTPLILSNIIAFSSSLFGMPPSPVTFADGSPLYRMVTHEPVSLAPGTYTVTYWVTSGYTVLASAENVVIAARPVSPPPWVQSYGRPTAESPCDSGWSQSWEQWPNGGRGGHVCTREIPSLGS